MSGLYSKGKALLEAERLRKKVDFEPLEKAKKDFEKLLSEVKQTPNLSQNLQWINGVSASIQKALKDYEQAKTELTQRIGQVESEQKDQLRASVLEVLQKSNSLDGTFEEIKVLLSQIFRVVTADAELKRRTCENINAELNR